MYLCVGTFLTTLKLCKASTTRQKKLGESVFRAIKPEFDYGDDDSAISAVFRGKRNLHSFLQLEFDDIDPRILSLRFAKEVVPLLDENKRIYIVRLLQSLIREDCIDDETHVELVNNIKKKNILLMNEIVFEDFLAGVFLYTMRFTDNLNKELKVKEYIAYAERELMKQPEAILFIPHYTAGPFYEDQRIRPVTTLLKQGGTIIDVLFADIFKVESVKANIVIPVNTAFDTQIEAKFGDDIVPLVSENTIHGQWIIQMNKSGISIADVDNQIKSSLRRNGILKCKVKNSAVGKQDIYPFASVASVMADERKYYLLALSEFDDKNRAKSDVLHIKTAINTVLDYYDIEGQGFDLFIPLVGTGRSRAGLSLQQSYELIKNILLKNKIYGRVHIVIHPDQVEQVNLEV